MNNTGLLEPQFIHRKHGKLWGGMSPDIDLSEDVLMDANGVPDPVQNPDAFFIGATDAGYEFSAEPTVAEETVDEEDGPIEVSVDSIAAQIAFDALEVVDLEKMAALMPHANYSENTVAGQTHKRVTGGGTRFELPTQPVIVISPEKTGGYIYAMLYRGYNSAAHTLQFKKTERSKQNMVIKGLSDSARADGDRIYRTGVLIPIVAISTVSPVAPGGNVAVPFTKQFVAAGGIGPHTWVKTLGAFPTGLTMNTAGVLSGTPSAAGPFNYTLQATDKYGRISATKAFVHTVAA
jgi:hypothetical protein